MWEMSATPAILIAPSRTGGTMLSHMLDSHYRICCDRDEPLNPDRYWKKLGLSGGMLMRALWSRDGYDVSMFRASYRHIGGDELSTMVDVMPRVIHLWRENALRTFVSASLNTLAIAGKIRYPVNTYTSIKQQRIEIDCGTIVNQLDRYTSRVHAVKNVLSDFDVLELTYEQLTHGNTSISKLSPGITCSICKFLGVPSMDMKTNLVKLNTSPLCEIVTNWNSVVETLKGTAYECQLD